MAANEATKPNGKKKPNEVDIHVGARVRMRRMALNMSQEKLGDQLGVTFQQVQKNEKGANRIGSSRLQQLSHILRVPVEFFFEGLPVPGSAEQSDHGTVFLATAHGSKIEQALRGVTDPLMLDIVVAAAEKVGATCNRRVVPLAQHQRATRA